MNDEYYEQQGRRSYYRFERTSLGYGLLGLKVEVVRELRLEDEMAPCWSGQGKGSGWLWVGS